MKQLASAIGNKPYEMSREKNGTVTSMSLNTMIDFLNNSPKAKNPTPFKESLIIHNLRKK